MHAQTKASLNDQTGGRNLPESGLALPFDTDRHDEPDNNKVSGAKMSDDRYGQYQSASYDQTPQPGNPTYTEAWALVEAARRMALPLEFGNIEEEANRIGGADFLAQGTLYPDVIESVSPSGGPSATIKSHHNVGGLPDDMQFELVEPLPIFGIPPK